MTRRQASALLRDFLTRIRSVSEVERNRALDALKDLERENNHGNS